MHLAATEVASRNVSRDMGLTKEQIDGFISEPTESP